MTTTGMIIPQKAQGTPNAAAIDGTENEATAVPMLPIELIPSAVPCFSGGVKRETNVIEMANDVPAMPMKNAQNRSIAYESANPAPTSGMTRNKSSSENSLRPPIWSVQMPSGTRMIEPSSTGMATKMLFYVDVSPYIC
ncbi:hypothetical protein GEST5281_10670 [Geobacillus stearothermophilus]